MKFFWRDISVYTETTDETIDRGTLFYDGSCALCVRLAARFTPILLSRHFRLVPAGNANPHAGPAVAQRAPFPEILLVTPSGATYGGANALLYISRFIWWSFPIRFLARLPGGLALMRRTYRWIAARRRCIGGQCATQPRAQWPGWMPLLMLPAIAATGTPRTPAWLYMWTVTGAIFLAFKWLTWWEHPLRHVSRTRTLAYLLLWPGMDAATFLDIRNVPSAPGFAEWLFAAAKTLFGALLVWGLARLAPHTTPLLAGWIGMLGIIFLLHFGTFHLLALAWQSAGIRAEPIMRMPIAARSLGEFWGARWNRGFNDLAHRHIFLPMQRRVGVAGATLLTFFASGLVHELAISLPARGGYGLPTLYFLLQGAGVLAERSPAGRRAGLRRGIHGRLFTLIVAGAPAFWLFHPLFVARVIVPFLEVIKAI